MECSELSNANTRLSTLALLVSGNTKDSSKSYLWRDPLPTDLVSAVGNLSEQGARNRWVASQAFFETSGKVWHARQVLKREVILGKTSNLFDEPFHLVWVFEQMVRESWSIACQLAQISRDFGLLTTQKRCRRLRPSEHESSRVGVHFSGA